MHATSRRKGQTIGVDFALSLAVFIIAVTVGLYYTTTVVVPASPFSEQVESASVKAVDNFKEATTWELQQTPILVNGTTSLTQYPIELDYQFPRDVDTNSTLLMHGAQEQLSQQDYDRNTTTFFSNVTASQRRYRLIYATGNANLSDRTYDPTVFLTNGSSNNIEAWNDDINATFDSTGIDSLAIDGTELVTDTDLGASDTTIQNNTGPARALLLYNSPDQQLRVFGRSNQVRFYHNNSGQAVYHINLSADFDSLRVSNASGSDQTIDLSGNGTYFSGATDLADFTGTSIGLGLLRKGMDLYVYRNATGSKLWINMTVTGDNRTLLLPHTNTNISSHETLFFTPPTVTASVTQTLKGLSRDNINDFEARSDQRQRNTLELFQMGYNISINGTMDIGSEIPNGREIFVRQHPVAILDRWGNVTLKDFRLAAWL